MSAGTPNPLPGGTGIRAPLKSGLKCGLACLIVCTIVAVPAAGADDTTKDKKKGDNNGDEPVYALTDDITPPRVIKQVNPQYSSGSKGIRLEGSVVIGTVVSSRGTPTKTHVVKGLDKDVDEAAVEAVKQWLFEPGKKNGKAVAVSVQIEIRFHSM